MPLRIRGAPEYGQCQQQTFKERALCNRNQVNPEGLTPTEAGGWSWMDL